MKVCEDCVLIASAAYQRVGGTAVQFWADTEITGVRARSLAVVIKVHLEVYIIICVSLYII